MLPLLGTAPTLTTPHVPAQRVVGHVDGRMAPQTVPVRTLMVASTGGHLEELHRLRERIVPRVGDPEWVTFDDPQSRSLLAGERVHHARYVPPRGYAAATANVAPALRLLREGGYERVISTGSGIALPFFLAARMARIPCYYIESAARTQGPSLTGRLVTGLPGVRGYAQYAEWADDRWAYCGSLLDPYLPRSREVPPQRIDRVVVTLGTMRTYGFRRAVVAVRRLLERLAPDAEVLWQTGGTDVSGIGVAARAEVPAGELRAAMAEADLVVAHAGIGSTLTALDLGKQPVLLPRRRQHHEHVDDHQQMIASRLVQRGLAVSREVDQLDEEACWSALRTTVHRRRGSLPFPLADG